jgi:hypothetical protein
MVSQFTKEEGKGKDAPKMEQSIKPHPKQMQKTASLSGRTGTSIPDSIVGILKNPM